MSRSKDNKDFIGGPVFEAPLKDSDGKKIDLIEYKYSRLKYQKDVIKIFGNRGRIYISNPLVEFLLQQGSKIILAQNPTIKEDWYIRVVKDEEEGYKMNLDKNRCALIGAAKPIKEMLSSINIPFQGIIIINFCREPEIINGIKYYPLATKSAQIQNDQKQ